MKSKKLLVLIASIAAVVVIIVIMAAVFSVSKIEMVYHDFDGKRIAAPNEGGIAPDDVAKFAKGKSTIFLSKTKLLSQINVAYPEWHAFAVVKNFPNTVEIHLVKCTAMLKIDVNGNEVYIDCFGYVMNAPESGRVVDATSAFKGTDARVQQVGKAFEFDVEENNVRLKCVLEALLATWQCNIEPDNLAALLGDTNVFNFDEDNNLLIKPSSGGTIKVLSPTTNLTERLIRAYGVYYNEYANLQGDEWTITVHESGTITTPNPDK